MSLDVMIHMEALFSPWVFLLAFVFCVVINLSRDDLLHG